MACVQWRYVLAIILFLGFILHDCFRTSLSITIVCMVNHGTDNINNSANRNNSNTAMYDIRYEKNDTLNINNIIGLPPDTCYAQEPEVEEQDTVRGDFRWTKKTQGLLLGAVFWGYMALQAPTGWLAEKFGAHRLILVLFTIASISCLCTPAAAYAHPYMLLAIRIVTGMGISVFVPSLPVFWSRWAPPEEWSRMLAVSLSGGLLGIALIFPLGGYMCRHSGGWPSLYYLLGGVGLAWCLAWGVLVRDSPTATPWISESEKCYIEDATKLRHTKTKRAPIPWLRMLTSRATIAIIATQFFINYGSYMLITQLPTYMKEVMKFNIASNGFYSMLPYLMFFLTVVSAGYLSDLLISRWHFGIGPTRKLLTTVGCLLPACCLMVLALVQCMSHSIAIALLCGAVGLLGISFGGFILNYADIALQFAGTLSGIGNCISTVPGIIAPYIVAVITVNGTRQEWQYAFFTGVGGYVLAAVIFLCFASGDVQPWARPDATMIVLRESPDDSPVEKKQIINGDVTV